MIDELLSQKKAILLHGFVASYTYIISINHVYKKSNM